MSLLVLGLASCASSDDAKPSSDQSEISENTRGPSRAESASPPVTGSAGGSESTRRNRSGVVTLLEAMFQGFDATAKWDGDTLVLALEGDFDDELEGQFVCGMINQALESGESGLVEFPNGSRDCTK